MGTIKVSLITTIFNEADNIQAFLESYRRQTKIADEFIIVDGGSLDDSVAIIEKFSNENKKLNIKIIIDRTCSKKNVLGPIAKGRNVAIKNAKNVYIAVTDAGCILDDRWFEEIIKPFNNNVDVVCGWYEAHIENDFQKIYADIFMPKLENLDIDAFLPSSRSVAFKKSCWAKVKGYPDDTLTAEDTVFDMSLKRHGCSFDFSEKAIVYWSCPKSFKEAIEKADYYARGDGKKRIFLKRFLGRNFFLLFPMNIFMNPLRRKHFKLSYNVMLHYQLGYIKGLFS